MKTGKSKTVNFLTLSSNKIGQQCSQLSFKSPSLFVRTFLFINDTPDKQAIVQP
jgi:hypothetical protein